MAYIAGDDEVRQIQFTDGSSLIFDGIYVIALNPNGVEVGREHKLDVVYNRLLLPYVDKQPID